MLDKLSVVPNVPQQIALKFPTGKTVQGRYGDQVFFTLADPPDTCLYLDPIPAAKIDALRLAKGEPFWACKRWGGARKETPVWEFWTDAGEPQEPPAPLPPPLPAAAQDVLEQQLRASLAQIERRKAAASAGTAAAVAAPGALSAPPTAHNGNGSTNGAVKPYAAVGSPMVKIPMDVALREIAAFTTTELKTAGLHLEGGPIQDLISTFVIGGMREGWIGPWQRGCAA